MQSDYIDSIESTPKLDSKKCRIIAYVIELFLRYGVAFLAVYAWLMYDYFIGAMTLFLAFIVMGIIRSKMRNSSIPLTQREYYYSDKSIAEWYCAKELCYRIS